MVKVTFAGPDRLAYTGNFNSRDALNIAYPETSQTFTCMFLVY